ncbi:3-oxoacyl-ACP reductase [Rhodanobacter sp. C06]|uniref:SDR family NAD(P)-dependent oxidoreductase n=1 Tax=Rhodanobacter sp. C06 TaxID=1945854 RepID=UPI000985AAF9|nr:SDR family oxidoreductase [Rhodanobacter sp. C06]OOG39525.1 3-oxoacyl-ACP reductase [Rhodanobacter sp. C06]
MPETRAAFDFRGWRVLVAGGSKGIGRAIALAFAEAGAAVSICARGQVALDEAARALAAHGGQVHAQACDLGKPGAIEAWIAAAAAALGGIDVLVNNASGYGFSEDDEAWSANFNVDLMAAVRASRAALPHLAASPRACILHTSSIAAFHPRRHGSAYAAMKAALSHYTTSQALQLAEQRIRVNAIAPGSIEFADGLWDRRRHAEPELYAATLAKIPFGRYGTPEEIAHAALFLASPYAGWITGQTLCVDGGQGLSG